MLTTLRRAWRWIRGWFEVQAWGFRGLIASMNGRWHYFRDAPDHVVASIAATPDHPDDEIQAVIDAARGERNLRQLKLRRQLQELHREILEALQPPKE